MKTIASVSKALLILGLLAMPLLGPGTAFATPASWNDPNFKIVWERTDKPVGDGLAARSWMWGPDTVPGSPGSEPYVEGPGAFRTVQYFDKSRMEVNNPNADRSKLWFVTNGLLVREMVAGQIQLGNQTFSQKASSTEAVAGDPASLNPNSPTYATFKNIASLNNDNPSAPTAGTVNQYINKLGQVTWANPDPSVTFAYFEPNLKHNIPNVFWDFMHQTGTVYWSGGFRNEMVVDWVFAMGFPLTEPYWTTARVGGVDKDVLVQLFERRVLTYTPTNAAGWKVEMGNVGQHYYKWRYTSSPPPPPPPPPADTTRIAFVSNRSGGNQIWTMKPDGTDLKKLTSAGQNEWPSWSPDNKKIAFASDRDGNWEIYVMNADGSSQTRLTFRSDTLDLRPEWSPDGKWIMFNHSMEIWLIDPTDANSPRNLTNNIGLLQATPIWAPDSQNIAYGYYLSDNQADIYKATVHGAPINRLTDLPNSDDWPTDWFGHKILFVAMPRAGGTGSGSAWLMSDDGSSVTQIGWSVYSRATFSADGSKVAIQSGNSWAESEIFIGCTDFSCGGTNITHHAGYDGEPDWTNSGGGSILSADAP